MRKGLIILGVILLVLISSGCTSPLSTLETYMRLSPSALVICPSGEKVSDPSLCPEGTTTPPHDTGKIEYPFYDVTDNLEVKGDEEFVNYVNGVLGYLEEKSPEDYAYVKKWVEVIEPSPTDPDELASTDTGKVYIGRNHLGQSNFDIGGVLVHKAKHLEDSNTYWYALEDDCIIMIRDFSMLDKETRAEQKRVDFLVKIGVWTQEQADEQIDGISQNIWWDPNVYKDSKASNWMPRKRRESGDSRECWENYNITIDLSNINLP